MNVDYKFLADNDPGGELEVAFSAMAAEKIIEPHELILTDKGLANKLGLTKAIAFKENLKSAVVAGALPQDVIDWFVSTGIDINHPDVEITLNALRVAGFLTLAQVSDVLNLRNKDNPKYPGLKIGHLQNAREWRAEGRI